MKAKKERRKKSILFLFLAAVAVKMNNKRKQRKKRRWWVRPWLEENKKLEKGNLCLVYKELGEDVESLKNFIRMDERTFEKLHSLIEARIGKQATHLRETISTRSRLVVTLRFLATGETFKSLMYSFRISQPAISLFVPEVCRAIYEVLKNDYVKVSKIF